MRTKKPSSMQDPASYRVGKGRPPLATRWKSGQSGNPKGRPKGRKNITTHFAEAFAQKLEIQENGRRRKITAKEAIVRRLVAEAVKGNLKAIDYLLKIEPDIERKTTDYSSKLKNVNLKDPNEVLKYYQRVMRAGSTEY